MFETLNSYAPWLLPPLLGAIIGYVTNTIAIRMLFRPLRPWYIRGWRIPLTPGIIPSKRHELARRMGEMVGSHLLTADDIRHALKKPLFREKLHHAVTAKLDHFLNRPLGPVISLLPERFHGRFNELLEQLRWKILKTATQYVSSANCQRQLEAFCHHQLHRFLQRDIASFLSADRYQRVQEHSRRQLTQWLSSARVAEAVARFSDDRCEQLLSSRQPLREWLPQDVVEAILAHLEHEIPSLLLHFSSVLDNPQTRSQLQDKVRHAIEELIASIDGLPALIGALFDMEKIYARLPEFMDSASVEVAEWLRSEKVRDEVAALLRQRAAQALERPLASYLEQMPYEKIATVKSTIRNRSVRFVQSEFCCNQLLEWLERGVEGIKDRPLAELLEHAAPAGSAAHLSRHLSAALFELLQSETLHQATQRELAQQLQHWLTVKPLGTLASRLPSDARDELYHGLFDQLLELLHKEIPPLVETLNIRHTVEEKVNSLDILKVEDLLMGIMQEQFKYINRFGALLGGLIGLLNLLLVRT